MKNADPVKPPKYAEKIISLFAQLHNRLYILGDLEEDFAAVCRKTGVFYARLWYRFQCLQVFPGIIKYKLYGSTVMLRNYIKIAFRNIIRHKGQSIINIGGLAVGMTCSIIILLWLVDEVSWDNTHENGEKIYQAMIHKGTGKIFSSTSIPIGPALKSEIPDIEDTARLFFNRSNFSYKETQFPETGAYVDPSFFSIFSFNFINGENSALYRPNSIIITKKIAQKYFGTEDPLNKVVNLGGNSFYTITGIIDNPPSNSTFKYNYYIPFNVFVKSDHDPENWLRFQTRTFVLLNENSTSESVSDKLVDFINKHDSRGNPELKLYPFLDLHFSAWGTGTKDNTYILGFGAIFILLLACINYVNLTTARLSARAKEIGMRKITGAVRTNLITQFISESVVIAIIAQGISLALVSIALPAFNDLTSKQVGLWDSPMINIWFIFIPIIVGVIGGFYPSMILSSLKPIDIIKGSILFKSKKSNQVYVRKGLVIIQFFISIIFIISAVVINNQLNFVLNKDLGLNNKNLIYMEIPGENQSSFNALKTELLKHPDIMKISKMSELPVDIWKRRSGLDWEGKASGFDPGMAELKIDIDFLSTFEIRIIEGRGFSKEMGTDLTEAYIVNEEAVKLMKMESPIGKEFSCPTHSGMRKGKIIGVMKNFHMSSLHNNIEPTFLFITNNSHNYVCVKLTESNDHTNTIKIIENTWAGIFPGSLFKYTHLNRLTERMYSGEIKFKRIFNYLTFISIMIAILGLYSLTMFVINGRIKEIGIRKVHGASTGSMVKLLSFDYIKWVIISNILALPVAHYFMKKWLDSFAYKIEFGILIIVSALFISVMIALTAIFYQTFKAARANPVDTLRYE